jgi:hypothetical protein
MPVDKLNKEIKILKCCVCGESRFTLRVIKSNGKKTNNYICEECYKRRKI